MFSHIIKESAANSIIAVLVGVSIPIFTSQLHKAKMATDWANVRAYYAELQADYLSTGKHNPTIPIYDDSASGSHSWNTLKLLSGSLLPLKTGQCKLHFSAGTGYAPEYVCPIPKGDAFEHYPDGNLYLGTAPQP